jgi:hypothetical protein
MVASSSPSTRLRVALLKVNLSRLQYVFNTPSTLNNCVVNSNSTDHRPVCKRMSHPCKALSQPGDVHSPRSAGCQKPGSGSNTGWNMFATFGGHDLGTGGPAGDQVPTKPAKSDHFAGGAHKMNDVGKLCVDLVPTSCPRSQIVGRKFSKHDPSSQRPPGV